LHAKALINGGQCWRTIHQRKPELSMKILPQGQLLRLDPATWESGLADSGGPPLRDAIGKDWKRLAIDSLRPMG